MNIFGERLKELRGKTSIDDLVGKLNSKYDSSISKSMISRYENGQAEPKMDTVRIIADYFKVSADYLVGISNTPNPVYAPELTAKDERDIQKELEKIIKGLDTKGSYAAFDGEVLDDMDQEDRELLIAALESSLILAKRLSKQKFTPKKYRD
ncbi:MAG: helix-turn-helix transcriptional regulator [Psychrobacillus psychrodurans]